MKDQILCADVLEGLGQLPDKSVNCCVTSPPYYGLRDYGVAGQLGLEETPEQFIAKMVEVFREVRRVLCDDGTLWVNIGDSYAANGKNRTLEQIEAKSTLRGRHFGALKNQPNKITGDLKPKDLIGIPWMLAFALRSDGWYLRQDIIWHKPNPMPESVTDRCTKSHEYIFLLSKSQKYYYDAESIRVPLADESIRRLAQDLENQEDSGRVPGKTNGNMKAVRKNGQSTKNMAASGAINHDGKSGYFDKDGNLLVRSTANKKSVWTVTTKPNKEAHFAIFPEDLIEPPILAGCPEGGTVLDPFMGAGTTAKVAIKNGRHYIGIEINPEYVAMAEKRILNYRKSIFKPQLRLEL